MPLDKLKFISNIEIASDKNITKKITNYDSSTTSYDYIIKRDQEELLYDTMALLSGLHEDEIELIPRGLCTVSAANERDDNKKDTCVIAVLPWSIKKLNSDAFNGYAKLKTIYMPELLTELYTGAFANCSSLSAITIPNRVKFIGKAAFLGCSGLKSMSIPRLGGMEANEANACLGFYFSGSANSSNQINYVSNNLSSVYITDGSVIADGAFKGLTKIKRIELNNGITSIGADAFNGCSSLTTVNIPNTVSTIKNGTFKGCYNLLNINIHDSITSIGSEAFSGCKTPTKLRVTDNVTNIGFSAFANCIGLNYITLPFVGAEKDGTSNTHFGYIFGANTADKNEEFCPAAGVKITGGTSIANKAFYKCSGLTEINIPDSVTSIGIYAFYGCNNLESILLPFIGSTKDSDSNTHFGYVFGAASYSLNKDTIPSSLQNVQITGGTTVKEFAFYNCNNLKSIKLPNSMTNIEGYAFAGCSNLTEINIPNGTTSIKSYTFANCSALEEIRLPSSVVSIADNAFINCTNTTVHIPYSYSSSNFTNYYKWGCKYIQFTDRRVSVIV